MLKVKVQKKNIEVALKKYKNKVYKTKLLEKVRENQEHKKDTTKRRESKKAAIYREKKRRDED